MPSKDRLTNVSASSYGTLTWLQSARRFAVPVFQRDYRWNQDDCKQLLADIRDVAAAPPDRSHFIGSILVTVEDDGAITLVDGQQRVTTLMLLLSAIRRFAMSSDDTHLADTITAITAEPATGGRARLHPHERYTEIVDHLVGSPAATYGATPFEENYAYFCDRIAHDWLTVWQGAQRLEHVTIELGINANAQQIFESLNSTGEALSDDELIHNYIHMGRPHAGQLALEREVWIPIEEATRGKVREFWRDYLVLTSASQPNLDGDFGIYRGFRRSYPDPRANLTDQVKTDWLQHADWYGALLDPSRELDRDIAAQLRHLHAFEGAIRPLAMGLYGEYRLGALGKPELIEALERIQTMFIRRAIVNLPRDLSMVGALCRELRSGASTTLGLIRRTPEDPQIRLTLTHAAVPHPGYVLGRLQNAGDISDLQVEHIYPQTPRADWSSDDGTTHWGDLAIEEQASYRTLLNTIGNLTLLESGLNAGASNRAFRDKVSYYIKSRITETQELAERESWDATAIRERTDRLIGQFLQMWPRPLYTPMEESDQLVRVVDLEFPAIRHADPDRFEYATFRGEIWGDVHNVKQLHFRVAKALWELDRQKMLATEHGDHYRQDKREGRCHPEQLDGGYWLYNGWASKWLGDVTQERIVAFELDDDFRVKLVDESGAADDPRELAR